jgi:predicted dithiol-disulfide oxidoreductase (DUF899 family)
MESIMQQHTVVSQSEWLTARKAHLAREKQLTRLRDEIASERRALPWVKVEKDYVFDTPDGRKTLAELFGDKNQLIVNHFMLGPGWKDGCIGCSFGADHVEGALVHLAQRDVAYVAVSRAPLAEIEAYKTRMGWHFSWVSSFGNDFNYDFHVSFRPDELASGKAEYNYEMIDPGIDELPGNSVFVKDERGDIFHTYSNFGRGGEEVLSTYMLLDMTPKGRDENGPHHNLMDWVKRHDEYQTASETNACCHG